MKPCGTPHFSPPHENIPFKAPNTTQLHLNFKCTHTGNRHISSHLILTAAPYHCSTQFPVIQTRTQTPGTKAIPASSHHTYITTHTATALMQPQEHTAIFSSSYDLYLHRHYWPYHCSSMSHATASHITISYMADTDTFKTKHSHQTGESRGRNFVCVCVCVCVFVSMFTHHLDVAEH